VSGYLRNAAAEPVLIVLMVIAVMYVLITQTMFHNILSTLTLQEQVSCKPMAVHLSESWCNSLVSVSDCVAWTLVSVAVVPRD